MPLRSMLVLGFAAGLVGCAPGETALPSVSQARSSTPPAATSPSPPPPNDVGPVGGTYVALGDSLAVGVGATDPERRGYVPLIHRRLGNPALVNLAVSGETSHSFLTGGQLDDALREISSASPPVSLVTLDLGGNDLLRLLGTDPCASAPNSRPCARIVALTLATFEQNYRSALRELTTALRRDAPTARVAVMTYFNPFSGTDAVYEAAGQLALLGRDLRLDCRPAEERAIDRGMNDIIGCVAADFDLSVAHVQPRFEGLGFALTHIGAEDIHANDRGYRLIADVFVETLGFGQ